MLLANCLNLLIQTYRNIVAGATPSGDFNFAVVLEEIETFLRLSCVAAPQTASDAVPPPFSLHRRKRQTVLLQLWNTCMYARRGRDRAC